MSEGLRQHIRVLSTHSKEGRALIAVRRKREREPEAHFEIRGVRRLAGGRRLAVVRVMESVR